MDGFEGECFLVRLDVWGTGVRLWLGGRGVRDLVAAIQLVDGVGHNLLLQPRVLEPHLVSIATVSI